MPGETVIQRSPGDVLATTARSHSCSRSSIRTIRTSFERASAGLRLLPAVFGGATRQASVRAGSRRSPPAARHRARPRRGAAVRVAGADLPRHRRGGEAGAAIPALPVTDTVKTVDAGGRVTETLDRVALRTVQTPQAFRFAALARCPSPRVAAAREDFTDDAALAEWAGPRRSRCSPAKPATSNSPRRRISRAPRPPACRDLGDIRTGSGFDVHAFADGDHVMLGGVPHPACARRHRPFRCRRRCCTRWSMPSSARLPTATSACISRRAIRNGAAPPPTASSRLRSSACARAAGASRISISPWSARRRASGRIATPCARASPRSPASRSNASASRRRRARSWGSPAAAKASPRSPPQRCGCLGARLNAATTDDAATLTAASALLELCRRKKLQIATAESCTGGLVAAALTEIPGSSDVVERGFVTYTNAAKQAMLGVPAATLERSWRGQPGDRRGDGEGRACALRRPTSPYRSPASPVPAAARPPSRSGSSISPPPPRAAALIHRENAATAISAGRRCGRRSVARGARPCCASSLKARPIQR